MMHDIDCPYCGKPQEINHDDGYGYAEGVKHQQQCSKCDKYFVYETTISFWYEPEKADCLNGAVHQWKPTRTFPKQYTNMECAMCGEKRNPTDAEMAAILKPKEL